MTNLRTTVLCLCAPFCGIAAFASGVVYTSPTILQRSSEEIVVYYDAAAEAGNFADYTSTSSIYVHTGATVDGTSWTSAPDWGDNSDKYALEYVSTGLWKLTIGTLDSYYGSTSTQSVTQIQLIFRNADADTQSDEYDLTVYSDGLVVALTSDASSSVLSSSSSTVNFTVNATESASLALYVDDVSSTAISTATGTTMTASYTFSSTGDYKIIATATVSGETVYDTLKFCRPGDSQTVSYSGTSYGNTDGTLYQGPTVNGDGSVTFCLYAPNKTSAILVGEWDDYEIMSENVMNKTSDDYFWLNVGTDKITDMDVEYGYYFVVDYDLYVADPYAKLILDPWNDEYINYNGIERYPDLKEFPSEKVDEFAIAVFKGNGYEYEWTDSDFTAPDEGNLIIYELLLRDFTEEQWLGSALDSLDYLVDLGVNAIELMPVMEFDGNNSWGYNPNFYFAPDKYYGSPYKYKEFINTCHEKGIAVIIDVVFNHTWGQHPWCKMYYDSDNNIPSSDSPFFNQYAPHNYSVGNDWKQEVTAVQNHLCDALKYWVSEYHVDGFRFDLVKGLADSGDYTNNYDANDYISSRITNVTRFINAAKANNDKVYCIMESFVTPYEHIKYHDAGAMTWENQNSTYSQYTMGYSDNSAFTYMYGPSVNYSKQKPVGYMESHDENRLAYEQLAYGIDAVKSGGMNAMRRLGSAAAFAIFVPGPKMIWQFGEMGYDISGGDGDTSEKYPQWGYLEDEDRLGLHDTYKQLISFRNAHPELFSYDNAAFYWSVTTSDWSTGRFITARNTTDCNEELVVAANPNSDVTTFSYNFDNSAGTYYYAAKSYGTYPLFSASSSTIQVPAHGFVAITNFDSGFDPLADVTFYLNGAFNAWEGEEFTKNDDGTYTITVANYDDAVTDQGEGFKISTGGGDWFSYSGTVVKNSTMSLSNDPSLSNMSLGMDYDSLTFTLTPANGMLQLYISEASSTSGDDTSVHVYFNNAASWSTVKIYIYRNDNDTYTSWDDSPTMTYNQSTGWWSYVVPTDYASNCYVIVHDGSGNQYPASGDTGVTVSGSDVYIAGVGTTTNNVTTYSYSAYYPGLLPTSTSPIFAYAVNKSSWSALATYVWNADDDKYAGAWPGEQLTSSDVVDTYSSGSSSYDLYRWQNSSDYSSMPTGIILDNNVSSGGSQTSNLPFINGGWYASDGSILTADKAYYVEKLENATYEAEDVDVKLIRTLSADYYNTFCVPFDISAEQIATVFGDETVVEQFSCVNFLAKDSTEYIITSEVDCIYAGVPYLIKPGETVENPEFTGVTLTATTPKTISHSCEETGNTYSMTGTYSPHTLQSNEVFLSTAGTLLYADADDDTMYGMRAYFTLPEDAQAKMLFGGDSDVSLDDDDDTTWIEEAPVMQSSTVFGVYSLAGIRVAETLEGLPKGIYIYNGKKVVVR